MTTQGVIDTAEFLELERGWSTTDTPFRENRGFGNPKSSKNGILVVQQRSGASNDWLKIVESLKLKLQGILLRFTEHNFNYYNLSKESLEIHSFCHEFEAVCFEQFPIY